MKEVIIIILIMIPGVALGVTAEQGQEIFEGVAYPLLYCFAVAFFYGVIVKMINRS